MEFVVQIRRTEIRSEEQVLALQKIFTGAYKLELNQSIIYLVESDVQKYIKNLDFLNISYTIRKLSIVSEKENISIDENA